MDAIKLELLLELGLVLLAPAIHQAYLWRKGKLTPEALRTNLKVFIPLYGLVLLAALLAGPAVAYSALAPDSLTTLAQFTISSCW